MLFNEPKLLKLGYYSVSDCKSKDVSVLFNEPKLLKWVMPALEAERLRSFSALQRAEIAEIQRAVSHQNTRVGVSVLFNEPKLLKFWRNVRTTQSRNVSVLFNEPKLLKSMERIDARAACTRFSALQRAEIAEIVSGSSGSKIGMGVSVLFNEPKLLKSSNTKQSQTKEPAVSVLFNEPKLLKCKRSGRGVEMNDSFSALQRAEIAEIDRFRAKKRLNHAFQCSSTSRNC